MTTTYTHTAFEATAAEWKTRAEAASERAEGAFEATTAAVVAGEEAAYCEHQAAYRAAVTEEHRCRYYASVVEGVAAGVRESYFGEFQSGE